MTIRGILLLAYYCYATDSVSDDHSSHTQTSFAAHFPASEVVQTPAARTIIIINRP